MSEEVVSAATGDGVKVAFAETEQAGVAHQDIKIGDSATIAACPPQGVGQTGVPVDARANQGKAGVSGKNIVVGLFNDEFFHVAPAG